MHRSGRIRWALELEQDMFESAADALEQVINLRHARKMGASGVSTIV